uniref:G-protein coupled receptors family 1 profile domain-containing protein n=1 Tax=Amphimedon queenslandica TaxID=400682 RepID=A0A1X7TNY2_AMPQE
MNNSTEFPESFLAIHSAIHVLIFVVLPVPLVTVTGMSIVALLTAKDVNWKIKVVLINILVPDIIVFISLIFYDLGYPVRVYLIEGNDTDALDVTCLMSIILYGIAFLGNAFGGVLFSVSVYIFTKHGVKKLKWIGIISYIATTWVLILLYRIIPIVLNLDTLGVISIAGFCIFPITQAFIVNITIDVLLVLLNITFVVIFSTCNFIFVKKNQIATENSDRPNPLKKAMTKVMQSS